MDTAILVEESIDGTVDSESDAIENSEEMKGMSKEDYKAVEIASTVTSTEKVCFFLLFFLFFF